MDFEVLIHEIESAIEQTKESQKQYTNENDQYGIARASNITIITTLKLIIIAIKESRK